VSVDPKQSSINITTFSHNPDVAVQMLNLLTKQYNYLRIQDQLKDEKLIKDEVDKISLSIKSAIEKKELDIDAYIKKHALISTEEYEKRLKQLTDLEAKDEVSLDRLRKQKVGLSATKDLAIDPQMDKLLALKKEVESNYQQKIIDFKPKHPEILKLQEQMNNINYQINNIKTKAIQGIQSKINYLEKNINNTQKKIQLLVQSKQRLQENDKQLVLYQNELNYLKNQLSSTNDYYKNVFNLQTLDFPIVTFDMLSPAITLTDKVTTLNNFYLLLLIGAVTAVGMVAIIHVRGVTYHNSSQIEEIHNIPVLADVITDHIALLKTSTKADIEPLLADIDADYKLLSNSIFYSNENGHPKVICCTSVVNDEHDWMTAAGLAITFAKQNRQVLLIDTHLKQPIINDIFHLSNDAGLTNILVSGDSPINSTQQTMVHNLHIIATGPSPANTSKLLAGVKMNEFLNNARDAFDIIILYAPAIQPKPDLLAIAKYADEIVISTFIGKTRQNQLRTALRKLISANVNPLGVVFNKKMPIGYKVWKRTQEWSKNKQLITAKKDNG
jgi:capsular exopolysaccharide synthesis family protein